MTNRDEHTTGSDRERIKAAVRTHYAAAAKQQRGPEPSRFPSDARIPLVEAEGSMCAPSDADGSACCGPATPSEAQLDAVAALYSASDTCDLPASVTEVSLGCGNPTAIAELRPSETVLDLGSGGGIDCFLAAKQVGSAGHVIGVDMTDEMLALAHTNAEKVGATNVEFRRGEIEQLPVDDDSVDVVISNCVINLSTDKDRVLREALRVLRPGGRLRVSDIILTKPLPVAEEQFLAEWSGCVAGALLQDEFKLKLQRAGFQDIHIVLQHQPRDGLYSADIFARKPPWRTPSANV